MFLVDVSRSMGKTRVIDLPDGSNGEHQSREVTNLEWALQFVLLKIQEMVYHTRLTLINYLTACRSLMVAKQNSVA